MKKLAASLLCFFCSVCSFLTQAQVPGVPAPPKLIIQPSLDAERERITRERAQLEAGFSAEDAACYLKFLVNNCLGEVKIRRRESIADLRRQEVSINEQERKTRAADQVNKTEQKAALEKQREAADRRAVSLKEFEERMAREKQKNADRAAMRLNEKANSDAAAERAKNNAAKVAPRAQRQAAAAEEARKFAERQEKAKERKERHDRDQAAQTNPPAKPLPRPE